MPKRRQLDGGAGDANYALIATEYSLYRNPEPAIAACINHALGQAATVLNVGAGIGSYEPTDRQVTAVEPSASMRAQRPPHLSVALDAVAEKLPFPNNSFDASMATFTVHQWTALDAGLAEMRRVTSGPVLILTCDPNLVQRFWLNAYAPEVLAAEARRYPALDRLGRVLGGTIDLEPVRIPLLCRDGFNEAYYGRPERLLKSAARQACSAWGFVDQTTTRRYVDHLHRDLDAGAWDDQHGHLRLQPDYEGSLYLVVSK